MEVGTSTLTHLKLTWNKIKSITVIKRKSSGLGFLSALWPSPSPSTCCLNFPGDIRLGFQLFLAQELFIQESHLTPIPSVYKRQNQNCSHQNGRAFVPTYHHHPLQGAQGLAEISLQTPRLGDLYSSFSLWQPACLWNQVFLKHEGKPISLSTCCI